MEARRSRRGRSCGFSAAIPVLLLACASTRTVGPEREIEWHDAAFDEPLVDGHWRIRHVDGTQVFAEGEIAHGRHVGEWKFYFHDGRLLARGSYGKNGRMNGKWIYWQPDGAVCRQRHGTVCVDTVLSEFAADHDHIEWEHIPFDHIEALVRLLSRSPGTSYGSGHYDAQGLWMRPLTDVEARAAGAQAPPSGRPSDAARE
jgi:hypothetical protein